MYRSCAAVVALAGCSETASFIASSPAATFSATACPAALGTVQDVVAPRVQSDRLLNARPTPTTALICEYGSSFDQGPGARHTLAEQIDLAADQASRLGAAAARIDVGVSAGSGGCPSDTGTVTVIVFDYRDSPPTELWWRSTGCQTIDNGATEAEQVANASFGDFQTVFAAVTRPSAQ